MATRSTIWIEKEDGTFKGIFCNWDGYVSYNGKILDEHYTDTNKIEELISGGSLSVLDKNLNPKKGITHDNTSRQEGVCLYHHRDFDKHNLEIYTAASIDEIRESFQEEYNYIFKNNKWYYFEDDKKTLKNLKNELAKEMKKAS